MTDTLPDATAVQIRPGDVITHHAARCGPYLVDRLNLAGGIHIVEQGTDPGCWTDETRVIFPAPGNGWIMSPPWQINDAIGKAAP